MLARSKKKRRGGSISLKISTFVPLARPKKACLAALHEGLTRYHLRQCRLVKVTGSGDIAQKALHWREVRAQNEFVLVVAEICVIQVLASSKAKRGEPIDETYS